MAFAFRPTLRFYGLSWLWAPLLPLIAAIYMAFTLDSAYQHARGRGGMWKGRAQANVSEKPNALWKRKVDIDEQRRAHDAHLSYDAGAPERRIGTQRICASGKAIGMRISRWRLFLFTRAICGAILAFYNFVRTADDIADPMRRSRLQKTRAARSAGGRTLWRQHGSDDERGAASRGARRAQPHAQARAGSDRGLQARRYQAALSRLGRSLDFLLRAVGDARSGRFVCRRPWRKPRGVAG